MAHSSSCHCLSSDTPSRQATSAEIGCILLPSAISSAIGPTTGTRQRYQKTSKHKVLLHGYKESSRKLPRCLCWTVCPWANSMDSREGSCSFHVSCAAMDGYESTSSFIAVKYSLIHKPKTQTLLNPQSWIESSEVILGHVSS